MNQRTFKKITTLISSTNRYSLSEFDFAIKELNKVLIDEKHRKRQIEVTLEEAAAPSAIMNLQNNLDSVKKNIINLNGFIDILFLKKSIIEYGSKKYTKIQKNINLNAISVSQFL